MQTLCNSRVNRSCHPFFGQRQHHIFFLCSNAKRRQYFLEKFLPVAAVATAAVVKKQLFKWSFRVHKLFPFPGTSASKTVCRAFRPIVLVAAERSTWSGDGHVKDKNRSKSVNTESLKWEYRKHGELSIATALPRAAAAGCVCRAAAES